MCWIFWYIGWENTQNKLVNWLKLLEYRWYDSAWLFEISKKEDYYIQKAVWKVSNLANKVEGNTKDYYMGIAHTRWATHGWVTKENTHPHFSNNERFFIVHNGIIENFISLKKDLESKWYKFYSETDSEVIANLIQEYYEQDLTTTIKKITNLLEWAYALEAIDIETPDVIVWAKKGSPLVLWLSKNWNYISSDPNALRSFCDNFIPLQDEEIIVLKEGSYNIYSFDFKEKEKSLYEFEQYDNSQDKWDFKHFMLKEIFEIPQVFQNAIAWRVDFQKKQITSNTLDDLANKDIQKIEIISSWTSYNAWLTASYWLEELANIPTSCYVSTEYKYKKQFIDDKTLYIFISQSWETADTLECLKIVKARGWLTFWIVNVVWSSIAQLSSMWLYTHSWVEVWVASTKAFIWQLAVLMLLTLRLWLKNNLDYKTYENILKSIENLWDSLQEVLETKEDIKKLSEKYSKYKNMFFLGRNFLFPISLEWSLKLKEITYHHTESYSAWELKHWPLSLIDEDFPSILLNPENNLYDKNISTLQEIKARNWKVLWVITKQDPNSTLYEDVIELPKQDMYLTPFLIATALDLFAYYMADYLWKDIDKPRNLAKSVTVE